MSTSTSCIPSEPSIKSEVSHSAPQDTMFESLAEFGDALSHQLLESLSGKGSLSTKTGFDSWISGDLLFDSQSLTSSTPSPTLRDPVIVTKSPLIERTSYKPWASSAVATNALFPELFHGDSLSSSLTASQGMISPALSSEYTSPNMPSSDSLKLFPSLPSSVSSVKREHEFLSSLPPEVALKRRRLPMKKEPVTTLLKKTDISASEMEAKLLDPVALKRKKNTDAARRSRLRKTLRMEAYESRVADLETDNIRLTTALDVLQKEREQFQSKEHSLIDRVKKLEQQLLDAHKMLSARFQSVS